MRNLPAVAGSYDHQGRTLRFAGPAGALLAATILGAMLLVALVIGTGFPLTAVRAQQTMTLVCEAADTTAGSRSSAPLSALHALDQGGDSDDFDKYVEFYSEASGHATACRFRLPADVAAEDVSSLRLHVNYRGPRAGEQLWEWVLLQDTGEWTLLGDNRAAQDWAWSEMTFTAPGNPASYIAHGELTLVYRTARPGDASDLDLQVLEITDRAVVCLNLVDEAARNGIRVAERTLARELGVPVVPAAARQSQGIPELLQAVAEVASGECVCSPRRVRGISGSLEKAVAELTAEVERLFPGLHNARWVALRLLEGDERMVRAVRSRELSTLGRSLVGGGGAA